MIKIGFFGAKRGKTYIDLIGKFADEAEITAICEADEAVRAKFTDIPCFDNFDAFLSYGKDQGMNAVFLANFFNEHTPYAIRCMEAGMDIISECTAASTMKECVELVRAVERTGRKYMLAENYPFMASKLEMKRIVNEGSLGSLLYAEGEYNHTGDIAELKKLTPTKYHWRAWMPRTYYLTHALGPIMHMTGSYPKYVSGRCASSALLEEIKDFRPNTDGVGMMFCEMDNGMIARFTGCTAMASDYGRYRICGDRGSVEFGEYLNNMVRVLYHSFTTPEGAPQSSLYKPDFSRYGADGKAAANAGHGGSDYWVIRHMINYFAHDIAPFFDVYVATMMSATAILGWKSAMNHGENLEVPDFRREEDRLRWENDADTPFPDSEGNGATIPCATRLL
ncbi:MAG: Gfo/Idh/MocA family oxidoreductase [Clostridia bacterium]|nr:Gfo/Idh/MocA family oxidoreductase [Clostridia bacterium]